MKITAKSPRYHAKRLRKQMQVDSQQRPNTDHQRRIDRLVLLLMIVASVACFATAWRALS